MSAGSAVAEAEELGRLLAQQGLSLAVMESCSGGQLADRITSLPGCGEYFVGGVVAYDTEVKKAMGVPGEVVDEFGVISAETAQAMAGAIRNRFETDLGIGVTGVAGPEPCDGAPVGRVYIAVEREGAGIVREYNFPDEGLDAVKRMSVDAAISLALLYLGGAD